MAPTANVSQTLGLIFHESEICQSSIPHANGEYTRKEWIDVPWIIAQWISEDGEADAITDVESQVRH